MHSYQIVISNNNIFLFVLPSGLFRNCIPISTMLPLLFVAAVTRIELTFVYLCGTITRVSAVFHTVGDQHGLFQGQSCC